MLLALKFWHYTPSYGKVLLFINKSNDIASMKKHVDLEHNTLIKIFCQKQSDVVAIISLSHEPTKKQMHVILSAISSFFFFYKPIQKR